jgi:hypothetical protein
LSFRLGLATGREVLRHGTAPRRQTRFLARPPRVSISGTGLAISFAVRLGTRSGAILLVCAAFATLASTAHAQDEPVPEVTSGQTVSALVPEPDTVRVYVGSDREGTVFGSAAAFGPGQWSRRFRMFDFAAGICTAPCSATVALSDNPYRVVGRTMMPSTPFNLPFAPTGVDVYVRAGSVAGYIAGLVLAIDGVTFAGVGAASMVVWEALGQPRVVNNTRGALLPIGGVFLGIGVVLAAVGIPLWLANHTQVDISEHRAATASRDSSSRPEG